MSSSSWSMQSTSSLSVLTFHSDCMAVHLAMELLGTDVVYHHLRRLLSTMMMETPPDSETITSSSSSSSSSSFSSQLYWRTPWMYHDISSTNRTPSDPLFVDITFHFDRHDVVNDDVKDDEKGEEVTKHKATTKSKTTMMPTTSTWASFGVLIVNDCQEQPQKQQEQQQQQQQPVFQYLVTQPLNEKHWQQHVESLQLDPQTVTASSLAAAMAVELKRQVPYGNGGGGNGVVGGGDITVCIESQTDNHGQQKEVRHYHHSSTNSQFIDVRSNRKTADVLRIELPYLAMNATGTLTCTVDHDNSTQRLDGPTLRLLYKNSVTTTTTQCTYDGYHHQVLTGVAKRKDVDVDVNDISQDQVLSLWQQWKASRRASVQQQQQQQQQSLSSSKPHYRHHPYEVPNNTMNMKTERKRKQNLASIGKRRRNNNRQRPGLVFDDDDSDDDDDDDSKTHEAS